MNYRDPERVRGGVYYVPAYAAVTMTLPPRYLTYQGFFDLDLDEGTTFFEDWGVDLAHATTEFVTGARQGGTPTPSPVPPPATPTPGGTPTPDYYRSDDLL